MSNSFKILLILSVVLLILSCNTTEPPPTKPPAPKPEITLAQEDASAIEAWIKITTTNIQLPTTVTLKKNNTVEKTISLLTQDSVIYIDSLLPKTTYTFQALTTADGKETVSNELSVVTMDTTSHNFTFQSWTFGTIGSSTLYDVAIIDENNIWAVGEILIADTSQNGYTTYNAVHWDGISWKLYKLQFYTFCGQPNTGSYPARAIFAFDKNNIIISSGSQLTYLNGEIQTKTNCVPVSVNKIWGTSINDLYIVGKYGNIAHYTNGQWTKIESGTDKRLTDIYGTMDKDNIWACGWDNNHTQGIILKIFNSTTNIIWDGINNNGEYYGFINTLWTNGGEFWLAGGFVYRQSILFSDKGHLIRIPTEYGSKLFDPGNFVLSIRGTEKNNIFLAGDLGMIWHYNGKSWLKYDELYSQQLDRRIYGIAAKDNLVVAVGWKNSNSWIIIGRK